MSTVTMDQTPVTLPETLAELLAAAGLRNAVDWWRDIDPISRCEVFQLWRDCLAAHAGQRIVACVQAEFVEEDDAPAPDGSWHNDFYEYLVNHEELYVEERVFHVCTQHPKIKAAIQNGVIPLGFSCGLDAAACPTKRLLGLKPGRPIRLRLAFRPAV